MSAVLPAAAVGAYTWVHNRSTRIGAIAVLPLGIQSNEPEAGYISDGIADALVHIGARDEEAEWLDRAPPMQGIKRDECVETRHTDAEKAVESCRPEVSRQPLPGSSNGTNA